MGRASPADKLADVVSPGAPAPRDAHQRGRGLADTGPTSTGGSRTLLTLASFVVVVAGMKAAQPIIVPFLMAVFLAVIASPALTWLQRRGIRRGLALTVVIFGIVVVVLSLASFLTAELALFREELPAVQQKLGGAVRRFVFWADETLPETASEAIRHFIAGSADAGDKKVEAALGMVVGTLAGLTNLATNAFLILLTTIFILLEASSFQSKLRAAAGDPDEASAEARAMLDGVNRYMGLKTLMSLLTGVIVAVWLAVLGLEFVLFFGLLAFLLNFIPNLGSILAAVPAVAWAIVPAEAGGDPRVGLALLVALGYLLANTVVGNVLEPRLMGRGLGLSTLVVFLSLVFWGWVLGPVGMLLSVPLTVSLKIVLAARDQTRWLAILLGPEETAHLAVPHTTKVAAFLTRSETEES